MIVVLEMSMNWAQDIQIICDLVIGMGQSGSVKGKAKPRMVCCNFDLTYKAGADTPRLGPGAFMEALKAIYSKVIPLKSNFLSLCRSAEETACRLRNTGSLTVLDIELPSNG